MHARISYIHTYVHTHIHILTYIHPSIHIHTYIHTHIRAYIHTYMHTHTYIYTYTHILTYIHIHTYIYTYTHIHIYTYIHTYVRTYVRTKISKMAVKCSVNLKYTKHYLLNMQHTRYKCHKDIIYSIIIKHKKFINRINQCVLKQLNATLNSAFSFLRSSQHCRRHVH